MLKVRNFILILCSLFLLQGCIRESDCNYLEADDSVFELIEPNFELIEPNYEIYEITKHDISQFQYFIIANDGEVMDYGVDWRIPQIELDNGLIKFIEPAGSGVYGVRFFDPEEKFVSEWFQSPIASSENLIALVEFIDGRFQIIIREIFEDVIVKEFNVNMAERARPSVVSAEFTTDDRQFEITYINDEDEEVTEIIDIQ